MKSFLAFHKKDLGEGTYTPQGGTEKSPATLFGGIGNLKLPPRYLFPVYQGRKSICKTRSSDYSLNRAKTDIIALIRKISKYENERILHCAAVSKRFCREFMSVFGSFPVYLFLFMVFKMHREIRKVCGGSVS